jgi:carboxyl-terminal processing protease
MSRSNLAWLLGVPAVVIVGLTIVFAAPRQKRPKDQDYELVQLLVEVLDDVDTKFVRELTPEQKRKLVADMINGGLERLDEYSAFYDVDAYARFEDQTKGQFGGVGILIDTDRLTKNLVVRSPIPGTPAYDAGILAGDIILKVDGKLVDPTRRDEILKAVQGPPGTPITLTVLHEGAKEPVDITMNRAKIETPSVMGDTRKADNPLEWDYFVDKQAKIAYIRLVAFNEHSVGDLKKAVEQVQSDGATGLILDLRDNPGGLLTQAVEICRLFMESGPIVSVRDRHGKGKSYEAKVEGTLLLPAAAHPMALLVNGNSASASEVVAAALQDSGRVMVVGERTYGKGVVQTVFELPDQEPKVALKLTTATYWRPSGVNIHRGDKKESEEWGVKPNAGFEVKLDDKEQTQYREWRRKRDVVHGKPGLGTAKKPEAGGETVDAPFNDRYLERALAYIRGELKK